MGFIDRFSPRQDPRIPSLDAFQSRQSPEREMMLQEDEEYWNGGMHGSRFPTDDPTEENIEEAQQREVKAPRDYAFRVKHLILHLGQIAFETSLHHEFSVDRGHLFFSATKIRETDPFVTKVKKIALKILSLCLPGFYFFVVWQQRKKVEYIQNLYDRAIDAIDKGSSYEVVLEKVITRILDHSYIFRRSRLYNFPPMKIMFHDDLIPCMEFEHQDIPPCNPSGYYVPALKKTSCDLVESSYYPNSLVRLFWRFFIYKIEYFFLSCQWQGFVDQLSLEDVLRIRRVHPVQSSDPFSRPNEEKPLPKNSQYAAL